MLGYECATLRLRAAVPPIPRARTLSAPEMDQRGPDRPETMQKDSAAGHHDAERRDRLKAIALMVTAIGLFSCLDATAKYLTTRRGVPVLEVAWLRFTGQALYMLAIYVALSLAARLDRRIDAWRPTALIATRQPRQQAVRSLLMLGTTAFNFLALQYLRLDQTITIVFLAPLVVALLAGPLLGEWVGWRRMLAILVGFAGVLIAVRPGLGNVHPAVIYSFLAMLAYALFMLLTRHLAPHDPPLVTLFYSMFVGTLLGAPLALADWVWPQAWTTWAMLLSLGVLGGTGHFLFILAYARAPASAISPFLYAQLITMVALGYIVFGDVPDLWTMVGAGVIIASGIYLVHRERVTKGRET